MPVDFRGLNVVTFESRRAAEMCDLIERHGGAAFSAPSMREVPKERQDEALEFADRLFDGRIDAVVFLTGVGTRIMFEAIEQEHPHDQFIEAFDMAELDDPEELLPGVFEVLADAGVDGPPRRHQLAFENLLYERYAAPATCARAGCALDLGEGRESTARDRFDDVALADVVAGTDLRSAIEADRILGPRACENKLFFVGSLIWIISADDQLIRSDIFHIG